MDLHDALSDMIGAKMAFQGTFCHKGIYSCANTKFTELQETLEKAMKESTFCNSNLFVLLSGVGETGLSGSDNGPLVGGWHGRSLLLNRQRRFPYSLTSIVVIGRINSS